MEADGGRLDHHIESDIHSNVAQLVFAHSSNVGWQDSYDGRRGVLRAVKLRERSAEKIAIFLAIQLYERTLNLVHVFSKS